VPHNTSDRALYGYYKLHYTVEDGSPMNQQNMPLVTAVVPVYNHERYVVESIRSILRQTYRNIELIVINDGSKDHSHEMISTLIEECKQRFVRFEYINRKNIGLSATLNQALSMAKGKYFSALASDDIALPEKLEVLVNTLETKDSTCVAAFGNALFIDEAGEEIHLDRTGRHSRNFTGKIYSNFLDFYTHNRALNYKGKDFGTYTTLISGNYLPAMSNVIRTAAIAEVGGWTPDNVIEDWEIWLKLSKKYNFRYVDRPLACYRWHDGNSVKTISNKLNFVSLLLLSNEKRYCAQHSLIPTWRKAYVALLVPVLLDKTIGLTEKLTKLDLSEIPHIILYLARRLAHKSLRIITSRETT